MRCEKCVKEGKRCTVSEGMSTTTAMAGPPQQWDQDGNPLPRIDPNRTTTEYSCSEGHRWRIVRYMNDDGEIIALNEERVLGLFDWELYT